jgi:high-affinity Fe2+/Pb2+ permease
MDESSERISSTHAWKEGNRGDQTFPLVGKRKVEWVQPRWLLWFWQPRFVALATAFFLGFTVAVLEAAVDLGSCFLSLAVFVVAVTLGCLGASVTG